MIRKQLERALEHLNVIPIRRNGEVVLAMNTSRDGIVLAGIYQARIDDDLTDDELCTIQQAQTIAQAVMHDCIFD